MLIGDKIRALRKSKNVTQAQMAMAVSVSSQTVSKWETHLSVPDISVLPVIARYFGITMDELFGYKLDSLNYKERVIRFMVDNGMLRFGEFKLKSGRISPYLIHSGYCLMGNQVSKLGEFYAEFIRENSIFPCCLMGVYENDIPLLVSTSMILFNKYGIDTRYYIDPNVANGDTIQGEITLMTDTFTSGATICSSIERIRQKMGKCPSSIVVGVDRMEKTENSSYSAKHMIENTYGVKIYPIICAEDIVNAVENGVITPNEQTEKLKQYITFYQGV